MRTHVPICSCRKLIVQLPCCNTIRLQCIMDVVFSPEVASWVRGGGAATACIADWPQSVEKHHSASRWSRNNHFHSNWHCGSLFLASNFTIKWETTHGTSQWHQQTQSSNNRSWQSWQCLLSPITRTMQQQEPIIKWWLLPGCPCQIPAG